MKTRKSVRRNGFTIATTVIFVLLLIYIVSIMSMYIWAIGGSLKTKIQFSKDPLGWAPGWPWEWAWDNYPTAINSIKVYVVLPMYRGIANYRGYVYFDTMLFNSLLYTVGGALVHNVTMWLMAYLITRFSYYKLSKILFTLNIALMTIPVMGSLAASLAIYKMLGWYDNYLFILVNNIGFKGANLLYYCAFIKGLGNEYYEAAYIDGAGNMTAMLKIAFPLTVQLFAVFFLLGGITRWNDYMTMLIWMPNYPTLAYGIYKTGVSNATSLSFPPLQIAVCVVLMFPMLVLFFAFQDVIMGNLRLGALKG